MSATLELLPAAIAAAHAQPAYQGPEDLIVPTRATDITILEAALNVADIKHRTIDGVLYAEPRSENLLFAFARDGSHFAAHFAHDTNVERADGIVTTVMHDYLRIVQQRVYERVLQQSEAHGMTFESEWVDDDNTIVITLEVETP